MYTTCMQVPIETQRGCYISCTWQRRILDPIVLKLLVEMDSGNWSWILCINLLIAVPSLYSRTKLKYVKLGFLQRKGKKNAITESVKLLKLKFTYFKYLSGNINLVKSGNFLSIFFQIYFLPIYSVCFLFFSFFVLQNTL